MKHHWTPEELADHWTLNPADLALLAPRGEANRLGFALLLKFLQIEGRFPQSGDELPAVAVAYLAQQLGVAADQVAHYDWQGRTIKRHRVLLREALGLRPASVEDAEDLVVWLSGLDEAQEGATERLAASAYQRCRERSLEPPTPGRLARLLRSAVSRAQDHVCAIVHQALSPTARDALDALVTAIDPETNDDRLPLYALQADPGRVSLDSLLGEVAKLQTLRDLGLPPGLFDSVAPRLVTRLRQRAAAEPPRELRAHA